MKNKIITVLILLLFITSLNVLAGDINDPEIIDDEGDAFGYIDIDSVWFHEDETNPDILFVSMKINAPAYWHFQQTFAVFWEYNNIEYFCVLHLGFSIGEKWEKFSAGRHPSNKYYGDLAKDDVLTKTWSNAFRRLGIMGRIGLTRVILDNFIFRFFGNSMWDYAPDSGYGEDYIIQY